MPTIKQLLRNIRQQQKNVSGWMGSWIEKIGDHIKKTYSPPEVAILILLSFLLIYLFIQIFSVLLINLFIQILEDYLEERSRKKK